MEEEINIIHPPIWLIVISTQPYCYTLNQFDLWIILNNNKAWESEISLSLSLFKHKTTHRDFPIVTTTVLFWGENPLNMEKEKPQRYNTGYN